MLDRPKARQERHWLAAEGLIEPEPVDPEPVEAERLRGGAEDGPKKPLPVDEGNGGVELTFEATARDRVSASL